MTQALFCVTCMVDNGCTYERHEAYVFAVTGAQAKRAVLHYWNSQYDTIATVETTRIVHIPTGNVICTKRIK